MEINEQKAHLEYLLALLENAPARLGEKKAVAGLDGFIDSIVKVIDYKTDAGPVFFNTIEEFGKYITNKKGSGFSLESEELFRKLGGNMPIMANAMGSMGVSVNCIGAFGIPSIAPVFSGMHCRCRLFSFTNPGFTTAIEFTDGKMMLAQMTDLNHADWSTIKNALGLDTIIGLFTESDLVCLVNWSELDHSNEIWEGILKEVLLPMLQKSDGKNFFFDLSDCSKRSVESISTALTLISQFNFYGKVTLSLNRNESEIVYKTLFNEDAAGKMESVGQRLFSKLKVDTLVIHSAKTSMAWDQSGFYEIEPEYMANPLISTGAGDNFNAGYCIAMLLGGNVTYSIMLANMVANRYMSTGLSPDLNSLQAYISKLIAATL